MSFILVPILKLQYAFFTPEVLCVREHVPIPFVVFTLGFTFESFKKFWGHHKPLFACFNYPQGWVIKKIWSPSNRHNVSNGDRSFFSFKKNGACNMFFPKTYDKPTFTVIEKFGCHLNNSDGRMATKIFNRHTLFHFGRPPVAIENFQLPTLWQLKIF